jgi:hypothetical protein
MRFRARSVVRLILLSAALALIAPAAPKAACPASPLPSANPADSQAFYRPEVRLRKLHLVRPDLIPYPIAYEVYC